MTYNVERVNGLAQVKNKSKNFCMSYLKRIQSHVNYPLYIKKYKGN